MTFLLRNPSVFDTDAEIQKYIKEGKVKCVKGDATIRADVQSVLDAAWAAGQLDVVLFTVGEFARCPDPLDRLLTPNLQQAGHLHSP